MENNYIRNFPYKK